MAGHNNGGGRRSFDNARQLRRLRAGVRGYPGFRAAAAHSREQRQRVRDLVLEKYGAALSSCENRDEAEANVRKLLPEIQKTCCGFLAQQGAEYGAKAELTEMYFTTRQYDTVTLPAGNYHALRITLGSGGGRNWWCIMFPALCLPMASEKLPQDELPEDFVTEGRVEVRFAVYEFFRGLFA